MHAGWWCLWLFVAVVTLLLGLCAVQAVVQTQKRNWDDVGPVHEDFLPALQYRPCMNLRALCSARDIQHEMFHTVRAATREVLVSSYRWRVEWWRPDRVNDHVVALGAALCEVQRRCLQDGTAVQVCVLMDQLLFTEPKAQIRRHWDLTLGVWATLGLRPHMSVFDANGSPGVYVEMRSWSHCYLNNIHDKFVLVDSRLLVLHSMNVEGYSHGNKGSWQECGVSCRSEHLEELRNHFWSNFNRATRVPHTTRTEGSCLSVGIAVAPEHLPDPTIYADRQSVLLPEVQMALVSKRPSCGVRRNNDVVRTAVALLQNAQRSILIMTPNFNDVALRNAIHRSRALNVRMMFGKGFNVDVPWLQQLMLGFSTNEQYLAQLQPAGDSRRIWARYYGHEGAAVVGKVSHAVHAKLIVVDECLVLLGSFNCDVYSTVTSGETLGFVHSPALAEHMIANLFEPCWARGVDVSCI